MPAASVNNKSPSLAKEIAELEDLLVVSLQSQKCLLERLCAMMSRDEAEHVACCDEHPSRRSASSSSSATSGDCDASRIDLVSDSSLSESASSVVIVEEDGGDDSAARIGPGHNNTAVRSASATWRHQTDVRSPAEPSRCSEPRSYGASSAVRITRQRLALASVVLDCNKTFAHQRRHELLKDVTSRQQARCQQPPDDVHRVVAVFEAAVLEVCSDVAHVLQQHRSSAAHLAGYDAECGDRNAKHASATSRSELDDAPRNPYNKAASEWKQSG